MNKLLLVAAAAAALTAGSALAQSDQPADHRISGPTIPSRQGINPASVEAADPTFWVDPARAGNLNNPESRIVTTYTNPAPVAQAEPAPAPATDYQAQAATPASADVSADVGPGLAPQADEDALLAQAPTPQPADVSATVSTEVIASAPVPDTPQNRRMYGQPMSHAGKLTAPRGN